MSGPAGASLDPQLKFSAILPDFQDCLARMRAASAAVPMRFRQVPYGHEPRQWIETCTGTGPGDTAVVFFHGGYWRALDAASHRMVFPGLSAIGGTLANAEYRLMPSARMADLVADAADGVRAVLEHSGATRVILAGHSAGAHLALSALRDPIVRRAAEGVVSISGVYDLAPIRQSFLQDELSLSPADIAAYSIGAVPADVECLVLAGSTETDLFKRQAQDLARTSSSAIAEIEGAHHMNVLFSLAAPDTPLAKAVLDWRRTGMVPDRIQGSFL